jgi:hypothetical protein
MLHRLFTTNTENNLKNLRGWFVQEHDWRVVY